MGIFRRIKNLWDLSDKEFEKELVPKKREKAVFITPNKTEEIMRNKENVTLDDLLHG